MATSTTTSTTSGTSGNDTLTADSSGSLLIGGAGDDTLSGGSGSDTLNGGSGEDLLIYNISQNSGGTTDLYTGGSGVDTVLVEFTLAQWLNPANQAQIADYLTHLAAVTNLKTGEVSNALASDFTFTFGASTLTVQMMETLRVKVDGVELDPADAAVTAAPDTASTSEDGPLININVLANDQVPDLVKSLALATAPAHGSATLVQPDVNVPSSWYFQYQVDPAFYQYLAQGESATDTFTYKVTDADGDFGTATVTVTISGTNDAPTISAATATGAVTEDSANPSLTTAGTVTFDDADLTDTHTTSVVPGLGNTLGGSLTATVTDTATGAGDGTVTWGYSVSNAATQYLAAGQTATESFTVTIDDGHGGSVNQGVTVTVTGTNDGPTISAATATGAVTEDSASPNLTTAGTVTFDDADLTDTHTTSVVPGLGNTLGGSLTATVTDTATGAGDGTVTWGYSVSNAATQYLAAGQTATESFTVTIDDGHGGSVNQGVTVTVTGTNDGPAITSTAQGGGVTEDADSTASTADSTSAAGAVSFTDVDLADTHTASFAPVGNSTALGTFALAPVSEAANAANGSVGWTYTLDNTAAQYLAAGESVSETYKVTVDDGHGSTATQNVVITISGTNDAPDIRTVTTDSAAGSLTETNAGLSATGTLSVTDPDTTDTVTSSVTGVTLGGTTGTLSTADVLGFLSLAPSAGLAADTGDAHNLAWTFDSGTQAFNYLAAGETLTLAYTVQSSDGHGGTDTQQVSIVITGTADGPTDIVLTGVQPGANNIPNGTIGQFSAVGATGSVSYSATLVEKTLAGVVQSDSSPDVSVSASGAVTAASGPTGIEEGRIYELNVTATDSGGSLSEMFRVVTGSTGGDVISLGSSVSDLTFLAASNDTVFAGGGDDTVYGQNGNDLIHGGDGNDVLYGMGGADTFFFDTPLNATSNVDRIIDFNAGNASSSVDLVSLSAAQFAGISSSGGTLAAADFQQINTGGTGNLTGVSVASAVNIVFDSSTGTLYYDADGGSLDNAVQFAVLVGITGTLDHNDFIVGP